MHLLFYYYLACAVTLYIKYPHAGIVSGFGFMVFFQDPIVCVWASVAGTICAFAATRTTGKLISWKVALLQVCGALLAFEKINTGPLAAEPNIYEVDMAWKLPILLVIDYFSLDRALFQTKTLWSSIVTLTCVAFFPYDFKLQLNMLAGASLF